MTKPPNIPEPQAPFDEPWQAELFALTTHLSEAGVFTWPEWGQRFGAKIAQSGAVKPIEGGTDYYYIWLDCLMELLTDLGHAAPQDIALMKQRWITAYQQTPHGEPVHLS